MSKYRRYLSAEEKAQFVLLCLSSNTSVSECCRKHNISPSLYYVWKQSFISAGTAGLQRKLKKTINRPSAKSSTTQDPNLRSLKEKYSKILFHDSKTRTTLTIGQKQDIVELIKHSDLPKTRICRYLNMPRRNYYRWVKQGSETKDLNAFYCCNYEKLSDREDVKKVVFKVLHAPPAKYGFNRTTWIYQDLQQAIKSEGVQIGHHNIRKVIRNAGYRWLKAKKVLTSNDPEYRQKLDTIHGILRNLKNSEGFFSIDEYGPFAVKHRTGKKLIGPGQSFSVAQFQKSKGFLILTAALELSSNQVTHFYSKKKDTDEMIKLLDKLVAQYKHLDRIFLSWDAASWHMSKKLFEKITDDNKAAISTGNPIVEVAPLPAGAQFLNVIESVFSGMARAVIQNSNYQSIDDVKEAINLHFKTRNEHFRSNPKKAGNKIWGQERTLSKFSESQNCKDPRYR